MAVDRKQRVRLAGWAVVGWCALGLGILAGTILTLRGAGDVGWRIVIRATAATSFVLFTGAYVASAVARIWPAPLTRWMLHNRRYLGVSFATSHLVHLIAIIALVRVSGEDFHLDPTTVVGGGIAYVFIAAMVATSFDRSAAWVGPRAWRLIHTIGAHYLWFIFALQYAVLVTRSAYYVPFAVMTLAAMGIRTVAWMNARRLVGAISPATR